MKEKRDYCPVCHKHRLLLSITGIHDRIHGIIVSRDGKHIEYLCHKCRNKINKGLDKGKRFIDLMGKDFTIMGYGLTERMDKIHKELEIEKQIIRKSESFVFEIFSKWIEIQKEEDFKYHLASLMMILKYNGLNEKIEQLEKYISVHFTNISPQEIQQKITKIENWLSKYPNYHPFE